MGQLRIQFYLVGAYLYIIATVLAVGAGAWLSAESIVDSQGFYLVLEVITLTWGLMSWILIELVLKEIKAKKEK